VGKRRKAGQDRQDRRPAPTPPAASPAPAAPQGAPARLGEALKAIAVGKVASLTVGPLLRLYAALFLGAGAIFLTLGWKTGPQRVLDAWEFSTFTARAEGRIVQSWIAVEFDPARVGAAGRWRASARASACAVVEYAGEWGAPLQRAYCGKRLQLNESYHLHDVGEMATGVPFDWPREADGFAAPQVRLAPASYEWLVRTPPPEIDRGPGAPATMLAVLERELDRPDDLAIASWASPPIAFPLSLDPKAPGGAMPAGYVEARREAGSAWVLSLLPLAAGLLVWHFGMSLFLPAMHPAARVFFTVLPLAALPWWSDALPRNLARIHPDVAGVIGDMMGDIDRVERLVAGEPDAATLAEGETLRFRVGGGAYAETLGRIRFDRPARQARDGDEALADLVAVVTPQVRAMSPQDRTALFHRLSSDKSAGRTGAGLLFMAAAREVALDPREAPEARQAAAGFLGYWVTQPVDEPWPRDAGFRERVRLFQSLKDVPETGVPVLSQSIAERALRRAAEAAPAK
jgi:hypothetical protein